MPEQKKQTTKSVKPAQKPEVKGRVGRSNLFEYALVLYIGFVGLAFAIALAAVASYLS